MKSKPSLRAAVIGVLAAFAASGTALAQGNWRPSASITPLYLGKADIDGGGHYSVFSTIVRAGVMGSIGGDDVAGVTLNYDYSDYSFSDPAAFGGVAPWNVVRRYGVAAPMIRRDAETGAALSGIRCGGAFRCPLVSQGRKTKCSIFE